MKLPLLDIDWQGADQIRNKKLDYKLITFFILTPSKEELFERLSNRDMKDKLIADERMKQFDRDVLHWINYDYVVVNDNLDTCFSKIKNLIDAEKIVSDSLSGAEDGELYMQSSENESFSFDDGKLKLANSNKNIGFRLRSLSGDVVGYAHASEISKKALERAGKTVRDVISKDHKEIDISPNKTNRKYYNSNNPIGGIDFDKKIKILQDINEYA